jgi:hypothetical protein
MLSLGFIIAFSHFRHIVLISEILGNFAALLRNLHVFMLSLGFIIAFSNFCHILLSEILW